MTYPKVATGQSGEHEHVPATPNFPAIEERVLAYWARDHTFEASVELRDSGVDGDNEFVFYDGPPFANGLPHYGHLLTGYVKDLIPRFQTMRGRRVERRFGWDTHGLPAELEAMSQLGMKTTQEILDLGIEQFNAECRRSVLTYTQEWRDYVTRQARWVDFDNDYKTLDLNFMESVLWAFKELYDKGLVYEDFRVLPYCWNDETPLSNHELRMDEDVYQDRQDPAVTVGMRLETGELALVWTTTPWTLPSNLLIMVGDDIDYVVVESDQPTGSTERYLLAEARLPAYERELGVDAPVVERLKGRDLVGRAYTPPFTYFEGTAHAHRVVEAPFVTTEDGTGLVHSAGAYGEEDKVITDREGIELVVAVGKDGRFTYPITDYAGMHVFDANVPIIGHLKAATRGEGEIGSVVPGTVLVRRESYEHSYPHCWRCRQPLIYMAVSSWFVDTRMFRDRMLEINQDIRWVPEHVRDGQFGKWLENTRPWSISRNRFWGSPIPVWRSDDPAYPRIDVYGSLDELERDFGVRPDNLHRPFVDELVRPNPDDPRPVGEGKSMMRRVTDVFDCWFESGSMPFAQVHYPFENRDWFEHHFPGDFIVEYIGQTRGWFYTMHVLASALFDKPAFSTCVSHGIVLGSDGNKMSKSLRNYPNVYEVFDRDGADAMRWFLMSSPILRGGNLIVTEQGIRESVRQVLIPLWNSWYFFALYANAAGVTGYSAGWRTDAEHPMDRYILAKLHDYVEAMTRQLDNYEVANACDSTRAFLDVLTNWYIRRSRERFWGTDDGLDRDAFDTLYTVLEVTTRAAAPLLPLTTEEVWRGLTGERSVHLADWPLAADLPADAEGVAAMDQVREVCSAASALRKGAGLRNRLPLAALTVVVPDAGRLADLTGIVADEVNVKEVRLLDIDDPAASSYDVTQRLTVNARAAGPRLGKEVQSVIRGAKAGDWSVAEDGVVTCAGVPLQDGEFSLETVAAESDGQSATGLLPSGGFVVLDTAVTAELAAEGLARDVIRAVQQARKDAELEVSDRIQLAVDGSADVRAAAREHQALIAGETLAEVLVVADDPPTEGTETGRIEVAVAKS
ncbi:MAG: isoleucine--tRNA ligase [Nocardioides sp.]|uniref:isoleucine--tRNA ligase n=1 Tax=Nocardioides sp. TaxID=35761 RepID=UPI0039E43FA2